MKWMRPAFIVVLCLQALPCLAVLGKSSSSIHEARRLDKAPGADYTVHERKAAHGVTLREYVNSDDVIFAVAWNGGRRHPDLKNLLGSYYDEFQGTEANQLGGSRYAVTTTDQMVVETWGHMGNLQGRAFLPTLAPMGMSIRDIK